VGKSLEVRAVVERMAGDADDAALGVRHWQPAQDWNLNPVVLAQVHPQLQPALGFCALARTVRSNSKRTWSIKQATSQPGFLPLSG